MPTDPDGGAVPGKPTTAKRPRAPRAPRVPAPAVAPDPFLNDKRYQEACAEMAAFGGKGVIERGFDSGARLLNDEKFKLSEKEQRTWDNFFYVLSKKPIFDVGAPWFLALFFVITLAAQLGWRVIERSEATFFKELFDGWFAKKEPEPLSEPEAGGTFK